MKTFFVLLFLCGISMILHAQKQDPVMDLWLLTHEGESYRSHAGELVEVDLTYLDFENQTIATESYSGNVGPGSHFEIPIGWGNNQVPSPFPPSFFNDVSCVQVLGTLHDPLGDQVISFTRCFRYAASAKFANCARGIDEFKFERNTVETFKTLFDPVPGVENFLVNMKLDANVSPSQSLISRFPIHNEVKRITRPSAYDDSPVDLYQFPPKEWRPMLFGEQGEAECWVTSIIPKLSANLFGGVLVKMSDLFGRSTDPHSTAAIVGDNTANELGSGVLGKGLTWGVYGQGQNGTVGITNGDLNGAGITGFIGAPPAAGGFKYGVYANSNSQPSSWAAAVFGSGFYTGSWVMSSDERLKTKIEPQTHALSRVMQLKPSSYEYNTDLPYGFSAGIHHGFIAQDVEKVFPELVSDIVMPKDTDPERMYKSPVEQYKGINYTEMISILTSALQELNTTLNAKIDAQAAEITELKKLIEH